jgi:hypothetical protein
LASRVVSTSARPRSRSSSGTSAADPPPAVTGSAGFGLCAFGEQQYRAGHAVGDGADHERAAHRSAHGDVVAVGRAAGQDGDQGHDTFRQPGTGGGGGEDGAVRDRADLELNAEPFDGVDEPFAGKVDDRRSRGAAVREPRKRVPFPRTRGGRRLEGTLRPATGLTCRIGSKVSSTRVTTRARETGNLEKRSSVSIRRREGYSPSTRSIAVGRTDMSGIAELWRSARPPRCPPSARLVRPTGRSHGPGVGGEVASRLDMPARAGEYCPVLPPFGGGVTAPRLADGG